MTNRISSRVHYTVIIYIKRGLFLPLNYNLIIYCDKTTLSPAEPPLVPHKSYLMGTQHFLVFGSTTERQNYPYSFLPLKTAKTEFFLAMNVF